MEETIHAPAALGKNIKIVVENEPIPMKTAIKIFSVLFFLGVIISGLALLYIKNYLDSSVNLREKFIFVEKGEGVNRVASLLESEKIIDKKFLFRVILLFRTKNKPSVKYGEYLFKRDIKIREAMDILLSGKNYLRSITVAEGLTNYSILKLVAENEFLTGPMPNYPIPEGVLLPETYFFQRDNSRESLIHTMRRDMIGFLRGEWENRAEGLPYKTMRDALVMASIIEKETALGDERSLVASVFVNRLKIDMPLQTDPTSIYGYAMGDAMREGEVKTQKLIRENSPYNTYKNKGLPPTPICNPGKDSIRAALHPAKTEYIFFVANGEGGHVFAKDYEEHKKNIEILKKKIKKQ
ncbi:MAG: endolytic transglycosylase MltG [Rickettsiales bacterium]|nr:endolytic transglycosylase MltG [Rickettsiales bacterium]